MSTLARGAFALLSVAMFSRSASAQAPSVPLDRVVVRWYSPETGGVAHPQFVFERELAFEARLEAFADPDPEPGLHERHVRTALDRHIAESLLASLPVLPLPPPSELAVRIVAARGILEQRIHGRGNLVAAAAAEGIGPPELEALLEREARASLYLDRMVVPMLEPNELELRDVLRTGTTPFRNRAYDDVAPALTRWYVGQRLGQAIETYYQNARTRVTITVVRR